LATYGGSPEPEVLAMDASRRWNFGSPPHPFTRSLPLLQLGESIASDPDQLG
jgi:hypothetical protein